MLIIDDLNAVTLETPQLLNFTNARMQVVRETCKNCKFWKLWDGNKPWKQDLNDGECLKFYVDHDGMENPDYYKGNSARASYDDSVIHTGPDFGCIHFEPKEQNG